MVCQHPCGIPGASMILADGTEKDNFYFLSVELAIDLMGAAPWLYIQGDT
jgi:hypothetical protein